LDTVTLAFDLLAPKTQRWTLSWRSSTMLLFWCP